MTTTRAGRSRRWRQDDGGFAMLSVIASMFILSLLVVASLTYAVQSQPLSRKSQDHQAALAAAQAGVDDFLARLQRCPSDWDPADTCDPTPNAALTSWVTPTGASTDAARYTYRLLTTPTETAAQGVIRIQSWGRAGQSRPVERSVMAQLRKKGFLEYIWFTDKEVINPALYPTIYTTGTAYTGTAAQCDQYHYNGRPQDGGGNPRICQEPVFSGLDVINGPLHSNDAIMIFDNPTFASTKTFSSWDNGTSLDLGRYRVWPGNAGVPIGNVPKYAPRIDIPPDNTKIRGQATSAGGCLYTGATRIFFYGDGTMDVISPRTNVASIAPNNTNAGCYQPGKLTGTLMGNAIHRVAVPNTNVIYVDADTAATGCPSKVLSTYPQFNDEKLANGDARLPITYTCKTGDVYVEGTFKGAATLAAKNDIIITGDLTYQSMPGGIGTPTDTLGLIAEQNVKIYHPLFCNANNGGCRNTHPAPYVNDNVDRPSLTTPGAVVTGTPLTNVSVHAAIMSVKGSFMVDRHTWGTQLGTLKVFGAIVQYYRGAVGQSGATPKGYGKNYTYDERLKVAPPPYVLDPLKVAWRVESFSEQRPTPGPSPSPSP